MKVIDLRSDTVTQPTEAMRLAMRDAAVGDDVYGDDPTVNKLEETAARLVGKEAAMFVPTGTMGNQICVMVHTRPGDEAILSAHSHIYVNEAGGAARLSGVSCALAQTPALSAADVDRLARPRGNVHYPRTSLVCMENALGNGGVVPVAAMREVFDAARRRNLAVHLDGARIFNAAAALGATAADIAACADSVMFCVSKGLCSPVGSLVCGTRAFVDEARRCRKLLGGGMRQAGVLAACGLVSLGEMIGRLAVDHENARLLGRGLAALPGFEVDVDAIAINMVFCRVTAEAFDHGRFAAFMLDRGVRLGAPSGGTYRMITHNDVSRADVETTIAAAAAFLGA